MRRERTNANIQFCPVPRLDRAEIHRHLRYEADSVRPVVFEQMAGDWPAVAKWTPGYLRTRCGDNRVKVSNSKFGSPGPSYMSSVAQMSFSDYLGILEQGPSDYRLFLLNLAGDFRILRDDIPPDLLSDDISRRLVFMFAGCEGAVTQMHYDIDMSEVFHTQIRGRKIVYLFDRSETVKLYRHPFTVRSYVDVPEPDLARFPATRDLLGSRAELLPGDTLFIPSGFWHQFTYLDAGYGVALRRANRSRLRRLQGLGMIAASTIVDRSMNKAAPDRWFDWKVGRADRSARRYSARTPS